MQTQDYEQDITGYEAERILTAFEALGITQLGTDLFHDPQTNLMCAMGTVVQHELKAHQIEFDLPGFNTHAISAVVHINDLGGPRDETPAQRFTRMKTTMERIRDRESAFV